MFNESIEKTFTLFFDSWVTDRRPVETDNGDQLDIGSASNINVTLFIKAVHQKTQRDNPTRPTN